jgi:hypothetical protein
LACLGRIEGRQLASTAGADDFVGVSPISHAALVTDATNHNLEHFVDPDHAEYAHAETSGKFRMSN